MDISVFETIVTCVTVGVMAIVMMMCMGYRHLTAALLDQPHHELIQPSSDVRSIHVVVSHSESSRFVVGVCDDVHVVVVNP